MDASVSPRRRPAAAPRLRPWLAAPLLLALGGCQAVVLNPPGDVAARQRDLLVAATGLMLLIILPVMALTVLFAWRYRASNKRARYEPDWDHSTQLELVIWAAPLMIIICLGALTWAGTHLLDPYRPLKAQVALGSARAEPPLEVDVAALDWKWLFIYPQYGIATVNELAAPVGRPISFKLTSSTVMNSFSVPALAGQIYAMPGMQTRLYARMPRAGVFEGLSAQYSGLGFSGMHFPFKSMPAADFERWIAQVRTSNRVLDRNGYRLLSLPSENVPATHFARVDPQLWHAVLNECVEPGSVCMDAMMAADRRRGSTAPDRAAVPLGTQARAGRPPPLAMLRPPAPPVAPATTPVRPS